MRRYDTLDKMKRHRESKEANSRTFRFAIRWKLKLEMYSLKGCKSQRRPHEHEVFISYSSFCLCWRSMKESNINRTLTQDTNIRLKQTSSRHEILRFTIYAIHTNTVFIYELRPYAVPTAPSSATSICTISFTFSASLSPHWCNYNFVGVADIAAGADSYYRIQNIPRVAFSLLFSPVAPVLPCSRLQFHFRVFCRQQFVFVCTIASNGEHRCCCNMHVRIRLALIRLAFHIFN